MPGLADYANKLDEYAGHLDDYIKGKPIVLDMKTVTDVELLMPLVKDKTELTKLVIETQQVTSTPVLDMIPRQIDFKAILASVKEDIDAQYSKYENPNLSSENAFMVFAHMQTRALTSTIETIEEAIQWFAFLKPLCDGAFLEILGDKPLDCGCSSCKVAEHAICYDGQAPQTLEKCEDIRHVIRKLKVPHEGSLVILNDEKVIIRACVALETLQNRGYQIKKGDTWMHRPWTCGLLAIEEVAL